MDTVDLVFVSLMWILGLLTFFSILIYAVSYRYRKRQNRFLYYPETPPESRVVCESPSDLGISNAESVSVRTSDGYVLRGFLIWPSHFTSDNSSCGSTAECRSPRTVETNTTAVQIADIAPDVAAKPTASRDVLGSVRMSSGARPSPPFVMIYFHGNAGNVGHRIPIARSMAAHLHCAVLMVDYRGYGLSDDAEPTQRGLETDAQACLDFVLNDARMPRSHIFIMGTSLGGAVAIQLAAKPQNARRLAGVIVENTFTSVSDMASALGKTFIYQLVTTCPRLVFCLYDYYFKPLVLKIGWRSVQAVRHVPMPMLFLSGLKDELVPPAQMRELYNVASEGQRLRRFYEFPRGMHNNMPRMPGYLNAIQSFVDEVLSEQSADVAADEVLL